MSYKCSVAGVYPELPCLVPLHNMAHQADYTSLMYASISNRQEESHCSGLTLIPSEAIRCPPSLSIFRVVFLWSVPLILLPALSFSLLVYPCINHLSLASLLPSDSQSPSAFPSPLWGVEGAICCAPRHITQLAVLCLLYLLLTYFVWPFVLKVFLFTEDSVGIEAKWYLQGSIVCAMVYAGWMDQGRLSDIRNQNKVVMHGVL